MSESAYLLYRWDAGQGCMQLEPHGIPLAEPTLRQIEQEIRGQYTRLIQRLDRGGDEVVVRFETLRKSPQFTEGFQVRYAASGYSRNPSLIFDLPASVRVSEPGDATRAADAALDSRTRAELLVEEGEAVQRALAQSRSLVRAQSYRPWIAGLLSDLEGSFAGSQPDDLSKLDRWALESVAREFETFCRERPERVAILLFAGFVSLCEGNNQGNDGEDAVLYAVAARGLHRLCKDFDDLDISTIAAADFQSGSRHPGTLRRMTRFLARLLGLEDL